jgi:hypothetical protein
LRRSLRAISRRSDGSGRAAKPLSVGWLVAVVDSGSGLIARRRNTAPRRGGAIPQPGRIAASVPPSSAHRDVQHLRVLIANERRDRLELLAQAVIGLGHDVIARETEVTEMAALTTAKHPPTWPSSGLAPSPFPPAPRTKRRDRRLTGYRWWWSASGTSGTGTGGGSGAGTGGGGSG